MVFAQHGSRLHSQVSLFTNINDEGPNMSTATGGALRPGRLAPSEQLACIGICYSVNVRQKRKTL